MKTVIDPKPVISKVKMAALATVMLFTMVSSQSFASTRDDNTVEFKYIGSTNNQPVFLLNLNNSESDVFEITLKNASGEVFFSEKVSGKNLQRRYRIDTDEFDVNLTVEVSSKKNNSKLVYAVNRNTRMIDDVVVSRL